MVTITYNPHTSEDILGAAFFRFENPAIITDDALLDLNNAVYSDDAKSQKAIYEWTQDDDKWTVIQTEDGQSVVELRVDWWLEPTSGEYEIPHDKWNSMVFFSRDDQGGVIYYSMCYWDSTVPEYPKFNQLTLRYTSRSTVSASGSTIEVEYDYASHVYEEAKWDVSLGNENYSAYHPNLDGLILKEKGSEYSGPTRKPVNGVNIRLNGVTSGSKISSVITGFQGMTNTCIPSVTGENQKLFVSKDLGVGFYNPDNGVVTWAKGTFQGCTCPDTSSNFEYYQITTQSCLFYYPETYDVYFSYTDNTGAWVEPVHVYSTGAELKVPVVVPSYIDLLPMALVQIRDLEKPHWFLYHVNALDEEFDANASGTLDLAKDQSNSVDTWWNQHGNVRVDTEVLFSSEIVNSERYNFNPLNTILFDDLTDNTNKVNVIKFWYNQLYISFWTFTQALRYFPDYNCQILDCGVLCSKSGKRSVFLPYSILDEGTDTAQVVRMRSIPEGSTVDNLLVATGNIIESLIDDSTYTVSGYTKLQMKHGIVVGYDGTKWEGVL